MNPTSFLAQLREIEQQIRKLRDPSYGANVEPYIRLYCSLPTPDERRAFQDALEALIRSEDAEDRERGVRICLGFFAFRGAV